MTTEFRQSDGERPPNVLLLAPPFRNGADVACGNLLDQSDEEHPRAVFVACRHSPQQRLSVWDEYATGAARERVVVDVEMTTRSAAATEPDGGATLARTESIADPTDLVDIGTTVDGVLAEAPADAGTQVLCFHSLTDLMQHCDTRSVFNFLEVLTSDVEQADVFAHYHLDPTAHDPETVRTLEQLFDATLDLREF